MKEGNKKETMKEKRCYISGPISGVPREVYMARFAKAAELLRARGYEPVNPTLFLVCRCPWLYKVVGYHLTLLYVLWRLTKCPLIYKMPGWKESPGANIESAWAYNTGAWTLPIKVREDIDKRMAKFMEKRPTPDPSRQGGERAGAMVEKGGTAHG